MADQSSLTTQEDRSTDLAEIRVEIDAVDDRIHAELMHRAALVMRVAETKRLPDGSLPKGAYRPAREASIIRRLHAQNRTPLPFEIVFGLWRQIIGAFTAMQNPVTVSFLAAPGANDLMEATREHFGANAHIAAQESFTSIVEDIRNDTGTIGVAPAHSENDAEQAWWTACTTNGTHTPRVIAALPFYGQKILGYCVSFAPLQASENDETLFAVRLEKNTTTAEVSATLASADIDAKPIDCVTDEVLVRVSGFHVAPDSPIRNALAAALNIKDQNVALVGAYPTPIRPTADKET